MKNVLLIFVVALFASCDMLEDKPEVKITNDYARSIKSKGVYLFIESEPVNAYDVLGEVETDNYIDNVEASNKNKKPLRAGLDMLLTTVKHMKYNEKLNMLIDNANAQYNGQVQAIIVHDNLMRCEAIKFKAE